MRKIGFRTIAPEEKCPPAPKLTLTHTLTVIRRLFSSGAIVWLLPNPKTNPKIDPNRNPNRRLFSTVGNCPDTRRIVSSYLFIK